MIDAKPNLNAKNVNGGISVTVYLTTGVAIPQIAAAIIKNTIAMILV